MAAAIPSLPAASTAGRGATIGVSGGGIGAGRTSGERGGVRRANRLGDGVHLDHAALDRRVRDQRHARASGQVIAVGPRERERGICESAGERLEAVGLGGQVGQVVRVQAHPVARRDRRAVPLGDAGALHRPLDAALELDHLRVGTEQPSRRALEEPFEEPFEIGKDRHGARNRTRAGPMGRPT